MPRLLLILSVCLLMFPVMGQQLDTLSDFPHHIIAKKTGEGIKLRWAPKSKAGLLSMKDESIQIYRAEIMGNKPGNYRLIADNIRPASEVEIQQFLSDDPTDKNALTVAYVFYSEWESELPGNASKKNWATASDELDSRYLALLYGCDRSFELAKLAGLGYTDTTADSQKSYVYKFVNGDKYNAAHKVIEAQSRDVPPLEIDRWEEGEGRITLAWSRIRYERHYSGFFVEKSQDGNTFVRLNEEPFVHALSDDVEELDYIAFSDSVTNYRPFYYRIIGLDAFGDESPPSESVRLFGRDRTAPDAPSAHDISLSKDQLSMQLSWSYGDDREEVSRFIVKKSNAIDGHFEILAEVSNSTFEYSDSSPSLLVDQYYQICAVDTAENFACSYPKYGLLKDDVAPVSPQNLSGSIDTNGVVTLSWDIGKEIDLYGYKVHVSNSPNRPFAPVSPKPLRALEYRDTLDLNTLTEYIYYKVTAIDLRQNASEYSEVLRLKKPDRIPPAASLFSRFEIEKEEIYFEIKPSQSRDVAHQEMERSEDGIHFTFLKQMDKTAREFRDATIAPESTYWYRLVAVDDDGNRTYSPRNLKVKTLNLSQKKDITLAGEKTNDGFLLTWDTHSEIEKTRIYRTVGDRFVTYRMLESEEREFLDENYEDQNFKVKVYFKDGTTSSISAPLFKEYKE